MYKNYKLTPLFFILINFIVGICIQYHFNLDYLNFLGIAAACSIIVMVILNNKKKSKLENIIFKNCAGYFFIFAGIYLFNIQQKEAAAIRNKVFNKSLSIQCEILEIQPTSSFLFREIIKIKVKKIKQENNIAWEKKEFDLLLYLKEKSLLKVADELEISNFEIKLSEVKSISGNQSFQDYLTKENIAGTSFINQLDYTLTARPQYSLSRWISTKRINILHAMKNKLSKSAMSLYACIFVGEKKENYFYIKHSRHFFNYWGIAHYLARSGIHVTILILIWRLLINLLPLGFLLKHILLLFFSLTYTYLSFPSITFTRAILIFMAFEIGKLINKRSNFLHTLILICLIILMLNPYQLFFVDFQLSFAITFALAYFTKMAN